MPADCKTCGNGVKGLECMVDEIHERRHHCDHSLTLTACKGDWGGGTELIEVARYPVLGLAPSSATSSPRGAPREPHGVAVL